MADVVAREKDEEHKLQKEKFRLVESDKRHHHEIINTQLRSNKETIKQLRKENKDLKAMIATVSKGGNAVNLHERESERVRQEIDKARLRLDDVKEEGRFLRGEVQRMREAMNDVRAESQRHPHGRRHPYGSEDSYYVVGESPR